MDSRTSASSLRVVALAGGVGGAKLAHGFAAALHPNQLSIIVNTGDDFEHLGLYICPDLDTVTYTLANIANPETGWGIVGDTSNCLESLEKLGADSWFRLGDHDLATHLFRSWLIQSGERLTTITQKICQRLGIQHVILPMCDTPCRTVVSTVKGEMDFQTYFVRYEWQPKIKGFRWEGLENAYPSPEVIASLEAADLIIFCPSNPFVSIDPILQLPDVKKIIRTKTTIAVSPIIGGKVVKGPAAKMFRELDIPASALSVAQHYQGLLSGFILDIIDTNLLNKVNALGIKAISMPIMMKGYIERVAVANNILQFGTYLLAEK